MKPFHHAKISVKKYGGRVDDYIEFHTFFDSSKENLPVQVVITPTEIRVDEYEHD